MSNGVLLELRDVFAEDWNEANAFEAVKNIRGEIARAKEGRRVVRFTHRDKVFYLKLHQGIGWSEILKNLLQMRLPIIGASNEWLAIERLHELGVDTLDAVAFGSRGFNPAKKLSFLITRELKQTITLEDYCADWPGSPPAFKLKQALIKKVAGIAKSIHDAGINHRDLYICHFMLDISPGIEKLNENNLRIFLVDLHRAQLRSRVPYRWLVKDIGSIYFSAADIGLTQRDVFRFIKVYSGLPLRQALAQRPGFWRDVWQRADQLYYRDSGGKRAKLPVSP